MIGFCRYRYPYRVEHRDRFRILGKGTKFLNIISFIVNHQLSTAIFTTRNKNNNNNNNYNSNFILIITFY